MARRSDAVAKAGWPAFCTLPFISPVNAPPGDLAPERSLYKWVKIASKMMNGMGTPRTKSKIERMAGLLYLESQPLNNDDVISLPSTNGRGHTGAKRANQQRKEDPQQ